MKYGFLNSVKLSVSLSFLFSSVVFANNFKGTCDVFNGQVLPDTYGTASSPIDLRFIVANRCAFEVSTVDATKNYLTFEATFYDPVKQMNVTTSGSFQGDQVARYVAPNLNATLKNADSKGQISVDPRQGTMFSGMDFIVGKYHFMFIGALNPRPRLYSINPPSGPTTGNTLVTINGANFVNGASVRIGKVAPTSVTIVNGNQITFRTPPAYAGPYTISVTNPDGSIGTGLTFNYTPSPNPFPTPTPTYFR